MRNHLKYFLAFSIAAVLLVVVQSYAVWTDAPASPGQYGSTPGTTQADYKPVNLGSANQAKLGNFALGTSSVTNMAVLRLDMPNGGGVEGIHIARPDALGSWSYLNIEDESSNPIFKVHESGNVGIRMTDPGTYRLNVAGDANATRLCIAGDCKSNWSSIAASSTLDSVTDENNTTLNDIQVGTAIATRFQDRDNTAYYVDPASSTSAVLAGDVYAGAFYVSSDARLKNNIETLSGALEKIQNIRGVSYDLASGQSARQVGVIAQEVEREFPELVVTDGNGYKAVAYDRLSAVLIEAVKELRLQNNALQSRLDILEKK